MGDYIRLFPLAVMIRGSCDDSDVTMLELKRSDGIQPMTQCVVIRTTKGREFIYGDHKSDILDKFALKIKVNHPNSCLNHK